MALASNKSVFLHVSKSGGIWIRHAYKVLKIDHIEIGEQHTSFPELLNYKSEEYFKKRFIYTFIRHPLTWYQSRWAFRVKHGWKLQHPLDYNCASNDFQTFVNNVLDYKPDGWVTWEYKSYIDTIPYGPINFIGRLENLVDDTIDALTLAGEPVNEKLIRSIPIINDSTMDGKSSKHWAKYTKDLAKRVMDAEHEIISKYYNNFNFDLSQ